MIDSHCHLTYPGLHEILDEAVEEAKKTLDAVVTCGLPYEKVKTNRYTALESLDLSQKNPGFIFVTLGLHPTQVPEMSDEEIERYISFIRENSGSIVGIGEIGLDKYWIKDDEVHRRVKEVFKKMLRLAEELGKPVVIHSRKAEGEALEVVETFSLKKVLFHSYTGNMTVAKKVLEHDYYFSVNYRVTNTKTMRKIARSFPLDHILTETDAPFLSPVGGVNRPANVRYVVEEIAKLRKMDVSEVDLVTTKNAIEFYSLKVLKK